MPELPEVELARRALVRWFDGRTLVRTEADPRARTFRGARLKDFSALKGQLERAGRKGKYLLLEFSQGRGLVAHLGMTGKWVRRPQGTEARYSKARFFLDSGDVIHFTDPRMFGRIEPLPAAQLEESKSVKALGLDPLVDGLTVPQLIEAVGRSKQDLKVALMDQGRIAGLGNIHAAEALFRARLHPARKPASLTAPEWRALHKGIHAALAFGLAAQEADELQYVEEPGAPNPFRIYGRAGSPCTRCKTRVVAFTQGGRTTHVCPHCQPKHPSPRRKS